MADFARDPLGTLLRGAHEHGDVVRFRTPGFDVFLLDRPDAIKHVLQDRPTNYLKSRSYRMLRLLLGDGLLTSEGEFWRRQRRLAQPAFRRDRLEAMGARMLQPVEELADDWLRRARKGPLDARIEMSRLALEIASDTLFGATLPGQASEISTALAEVQSYANHITTRPLVVPRSVPTPRNRRYERASSVLDRTVADLIEGRRQVVERGEDPGDDLLALLMAATDEETGEGMTDAQLRDEVMTLFLAGHETSATGLTWALVQLARHPDVEARCREEVLRVTGGAPPTVAQLRDMPYLRAFVDEVLRLHPPAWIMEREPIQDDEIVGYPIPKGSVVIVSPYVTHRNPALWDRPHRFDPERFLGAEARERQRYAYFPFGGGPRQCVGNNFALMEMQLTLARLLSRFRISLVPDQRIEQLPYVTLQPDGPVLIRVEPL